ncbi:MAG: quinone-dependent dihydroorotate dehydrogenase [Hyphomonadaceae bacterium]
MSLFDLAARAARLLPPESAHRATVRALSKGLGPAHPPQDDPRLAVTLKRAGLPLPNPIGLAAGFDKNAETIRAMLGFGFGFVECGTVTPRAQPGNPRPRLFRLEEDRAVINRMGFNNEGLGPFVARLQAYDGGGVVGANVGANKDSVDRVADYETGVRAVWPHCAYITVNISSPNTPGLRGLQDKGALEELLARVKAAGAAMEAEHGARPIFLKVAPDLDDRSVHDIAAVAIESGALCGLIVSNTTLDRAHTLISEHAGEQGGLSGAPLMEKSTLVLRQFAESLAGRLDLIGAGGVGSASDVLRKLRAGADAVQLYSMMVFEGPGLVGRIKRELLEMMDRTQANNLEELKAAHDAA